jgi:7-cyano-7-deazaguanine synthase
MIGSALVVLSGGQDSTTCLYWAKQNFDRVCAVTFDYGQKHCREIESAKIIAKMADVPHEVISLGHLFAGLSPLTNTAEKLELYESAEKLPGGLEKTFVPGRNILFLSVAANRAYVLDCHSLVIGVSQEDFGGYPDCREDFIDKMREALASGLDYKLQIYAPLMKMDKEQTVLLAKNMPGCLEALAYSTTCYEGAEPPCAHCHACLLRERGFTKAQIIDPLIARLTPAANIGTGVNAR